MKEYIMKIVEDMGGKTEDTRRRMCEYFIFLYLYTENQCCFMMRDMDLTTERHPLPPFLPTGAEVLMLGSFPPGRERWKMDFYYPNFQNDMWRIFGLVFFRDKEYFLSADRKSYNEPLIRSFLTEKGIAITDTAKEVIRHKGNASDKFLEVVEALDLPIVLQQIPRCRAIVTTGQKATDTLFTMVDAATVPVVGGYADVRCGVRPLRVYRLPSSSRAYPKPLLEKASVYEMMFRDLGVL